MCIQILFCSQDEIDGLQRKLEIESKRMKAMKDKARSVNAKEDEIHGLNQELTELQVRRVFIWLQSGACLIPHICFTLLFIVSEITLLFIVSEIKCSPPRSAFPLESEITGWEEKERWPRWPQAAAWEHHQSHQNWNSEIFQSCFPYSLGICRFSLIHLQALDEAGDESDQVGQALNQMQKKVMNQLNRSAHEAERAQAQRDKVSEPLCHVITSFSSHLVSLCVSLCVSGWTRSSTSEGPNHPGADEGERGCWTSNPSHGGLDYWLFPYHN